MSTLANDATQPLQAKAMEMQHSPLRVMRIIDRMIVGGPTRHVIWLTQGLDASKFTTELVTGSAARGEVDVTPRLTSAGLTSTIVPELGRELGPKDAIALFKLLKLMWRFQPEIVHTHKSKAGALGRTAALLYKWLTPSAFRLKPRKCYTVHTYHGHIFHSYYSRLKTCFFLTIERLLAKIATDRIVVISEQQRREISEHFKVGSPRQFRVIPLGIDFDEMDSSPGLFRAQHNIAGEEVVIGTAGRICEVKNYSLLLAAAARLAERRPKAEKRRFVIAGEGHLRSELEKVAQSLGVSQEVLFSGVCWEMNRFYADIDLVALTSLNEGTPLTLIEAMACGRAVISTEVGGVVDIMGDRLETNRHFSVWSHGITIPSGHAEDFAIGLEFLLNDARLRARMGEAARLFVRSKFCKSRLISDIQQLYASLVENAGPARGKSIS